MKAKSALFFLSSLMILSSCGNMNSPASSISEEPVISVEQEEKEDGLTLLHEPKIRKASVKEDPKLSIAGHNLSLVSNVQILYYVQNTYAESSILDKGMLFWKNAPDHYEYENAEFVLNTSYVCPVGDVDYDLYRFDEMAAKEMSEYAYAVAYVRDNTGYHYSTPDKYSVLNYCFNMKNSTSRLSGNAQITLGELCHNVLDYGAAAQKAFGYKLDRLANDTYYELEMDGGTLDDGFGHGLFKENELIPVGHDAFEDLNNDYAQFDAPENKITMPAYNLSLRRISKGLSYHDNGDGTASISGYGDCTDADVWAPHMNEGNRVTSVGGNAFWGQGITSFVPSELITSIGNNAFNDCSQLTKIELTDSITSIGNSAFSWTELTEVDIPDSVTSIGEMCFFECGSLQEIRVGSGVKDIPFHALAFCDQLKKVTILAAETIGSNAFRGDSALTDISIPSTMKVLADNSFMDCYGLKAITLPSGLTKIGKRAFSGCTHIATLKIPLSVTTMEEQVFESWQEEQTINIAAASKPAGWHDNWKGNARSKVNWNRR